jgi:DNA-directed RNA polymerase subunit M/transcription elongation factor TFIIS
MLSKGNCEKCGNALLRNNSLRSDGGKLTLHQCSKCGYCYESGLRYNTLIKQYVKYIRLTSRYSLTVIRHLNRM